MNDLVRHLRDFASDYCTTTYHDELVRNAADAIEARDAEIERLRADLALMTQGHDSALRTVQRLAADLAAAKALLREIKDQCRMADMMQWPNKLYWRLCAALGDEP